MVYDGMTMELLWSFDYDCAKIEKAIAELARYAHEFTVTMVCASSWNMKHLDPQSGRCPECIQNTVTLIELIQQPQK